LGFRIGLLYTRFASMPQALWAALREDGHEVIRPRGPADPHPDVHRGHGALRQAGSPDVILCPGG
jgi:hypothetical protein